MPELEHLKLGASAGSVALATSEDNRLAALNLVRQARRTVHIFSRDLDPAVYDQVEFIEVVTRLATRSRRARILILVQDPSRVVRHGHRLVELGQRLSSYIELRRPSVEYQTYNEAFLVVDETGLLHRRLADRYAGTVDFHAPIEARELVKFFTGVWEKGAPDPELRRLHI